VRAVRAVRAVRIRRVGAGPGAGAAAGARFGASTAPGLRANLVGCDAAKLRIVYGGDDGFLSIG
jgi:hypothetical protein